MHVAVYSTFLDRRNVLHEVLLTTLMEQQTATNALLTQTHPTIMNHPTSYIPSSTSPFLYNNSKNALYAQRKYIMTCNSLHTQDPQYFVTSHSKMGLGSDHNLTTIRLLYYPPLPPDIEIKPGQLRCGEHVDYGSITLLFQDPSGGLQVLHGTTVHVCKSDKVSSHFQVKRSDGGGYIDVPYIADAILVNLGSLMQQWTSDLYLATVRLNIWHL